MNGLEGDNREHAPGTLAGNLIEVRGEFLVLVDAEMGHVGHSGRVLLP